jgi:CRISPR/Cas system endoribonuclease Cas6 (RAMP superfamily)
MAEVDLEINTDQTSALIHQNLSLSPVILINSCSVNKQTQPKRRMLKAKFIQIEYYEYLKTNLIKIYKPLHTALYS